MWKNVVERDRPQMTIWRMCIACWIPKATNTYTGYVILIVSPQQQWLHERAWIWRYVYFACLVCFVRSFENYLKKPLFSCFIFCRTTSLLAVTVLPLLAFHYTTGHASRWERDWRQFWHFVLLVTCLSLTIQLVTPIAKWNRPSGGLSDEPADMHVKIIPHLNVLSKMIIFILTYSVGCHSVQSIGGILSAQGYRINRGLFDRASSSWNKVKCQFDTTR